MNDRIDDAPPGKTEDFPQDGGRADPVMRGIDWSGSSLGPPETWPLPLRTVAGIIMAARQPMFLAWGPDLTFLYNDDYAPILGARHPRAMGLPFAEVWPDIWGQIEPLVLRTMAGEASFHENLLIPMQRNGYREEAWFTFSYTPVRDEAGSVAGMLCVATETTRQVLAERRVAAETERQRRIFQQAPGFICTLHGPTHVFDFVNEAHRRLFGSDDWIGKPVREAFPDIAGQGFYELLDKVYRSGERVVLHEAAIRYRVRPDGPEEQRILDFIYEPLTDEAGRVTGIFCEGHDVTKTHEARSALRDAWTLAEKRAAEQSAILAQLAEGVIVTDADGRITFVNDAAMRLHGIARLDVAPEDYSDAYHLFTHDGRPYPPQDLPLARAVRGEVAAESRWRIHRSDGTEVLAIGSARPLFGNDGSRSGAVLTLRDDTQREASERRLRENEARLRALADNLPAGMVYQIVTGPSGTERRFVYLSQSFEKLTGVTVDAVLADPAIPYEMILREHWPKMIEAEAAAIRDRSPFDVEVQFRRADGVVRWCRIISAPRDQADGSLIWDGIQIDITGQKMAEEHLRLLVNELNHRVKNSLATVQAIASQTFRNRVSVEEAKAEFTARLLALANAHDILTETNWSGASIRQVVERTLEPHHRPGRFRIDGPDVLVGPKAALALSMAVHELCTNAVKYGALSTERGRVDIVWRVRAQEGGHGFHLRWTERGGPPVAAPTRKGFGSRLFDFALAAELDGEVKIAYEPGGVVCTIDASVPAPA